MPSKSEYKCACCGAAFVARTADRARGWARFCSKACKAKKQGRLPASKETKEMWREYNREYAKFRIARHWSQMDEHEAILDDLEETDDDKWGDSGLHSI